MGPNLSCMFGANIGKHGVKMGHLYIDTMQGEADPLVTDECETL